MYYLWTRNHFEPQPKSHIKMQKDGRAALVSTARYNHPQKGFEMPQKMTTDYTVPKAMIKSNLSPKFQFEFPWDIKY